MHAPRDPTSLALEAVISRFGSMVRSVGHQHRLSESDLDEVMQEVRIRLWRAHGESEQYAAIRAKRKGAVEYFNSVLVEGVAAPV